MKFKELEKLVNEGELILTNYRGEEVEKATLDILLSSVCKKIRSILEERGIKDYKLSTYNQRIYLDHQKYFKYYRNEPSGIIIKVKKEKVDSHYNYFSTTTYYRFKNIEIEEVERFIDGKLNKIESIEDYFKYEELMDQKDKEMIENKKNEFVNKINDMQEFLKLMKEFKGLNYDTKREIAQDAFGEDYWKYI